jgi:hypothetical protein
MDLAKFLWMLERGALYFCRADLLGDPYEGYYTEPEVKLDGAAAFAHLRKQIVAITRSMYVNCWHMNNSESAAMWKLYTSHHQSVCVRSTYELLSQVLPRECMLGCIKYIDYSRDLIDRSIVLNYITHKRKSFEHEKEVRAVFWDSSRLKDVLTEGPPEPAGNIYAVDLNRLITAIYVSPAADDLLLDVVEGISNQYGLSAPVLMSGVNAPPAY